MEAPDRQANFMAKSFSKLIGDYDASLVPHGKWSITI
jgi:hypothetical protein